MTALGRKARGGSAHRETPGLGKDEEGMAEVP